MCWSEPADMYFQSHDIRRILYLVLLHDIIQVKYRELQQLRKIGHWNVFKTSASTALSKIGDLKAECVTVIRSFWSRKFLLKNIFFR